MAKAGIEKIHGTGRCAHHRTVTTASQLRSMGFTDYDAKITNEIRTNWRYTPFLSDGVPQPVCTAVTFVYSQY